MFLKLYLFALGFYKVRVTGFSYPRFLNLAAFNNIYIKSITEEQGGIIFTVSRGDFAGIKRLAAKAGCSCEIIKEGGLPKITRPLRGKKSFMLGAAVFGLFLIIMSRFVWIIDVSGNERTPTGEILSFCEEQGLKNGALKSALDTNRLEKEIKNEFEEISFVSVSVKGVRALITVSETIPKEDFSADNTPMDIVSDCDALVTRISARSGRPLVKVGMSVSKGDILISAETEIKAEQEVLGIRPVKAEGKVYGKTILCYNYTVPYEEKYKKYSDKAYNQYEIEVFNKKISLNIIKRDTNSEKCDKIESKNQLKLLGGEGLPIIINKTRFLPYEEGTRRLSPEQAKQKAERLAVFKIINTYPPDSEVLNKSLSYEETETGLNVRAEITVIKQIGVLKPYEPKENNERETANGETQN